MAPPTLCDFFDLLNRIITLALGASGAAALVFLLLGGFKFVISGGEPQKVSQARNTLTWAIAGLGLILLSFAIIKLLGHIIGYDLLTVEGIECP